MLAFRVLFEDSFLIVVDKPSGFHSHAPEDKNIRISPAWNGLRILERQFQQKLYPAHRLDRATSGVFVLAKSSEMASSLQKQFQSNLVTKNYICLSRGNLVGSNEIIEPLKNASGNFLDSQTFIREIFSFRLPLIDKNGNERTFTLIHAIPKTGRFHQIRRHLAHLGLPIIGDAQHGDKKINKEFTDLTKIKKLMLRSTAISFMHPNDQSPITIKARWNREWHALFEIAGFCAFLPSTEEAIA